MKIINTMFLLEPESADNNRILYIPKGTQATNGIAAKFLKTNDSKAEIIIREDATLEKAVNGQDWTYKTLRIYPLPQEIAELTKSKNKINIPETIQSQLLNYLYLGNPEDYY
jgi:hypothetical protein